MKRDCDHNLRGMLLPCLNCEKNAKTWGRVSSCSPAAGASRWLCTLRASVRSW